MTLAEEAATSTTDSTGRAALDNEFRAIEGEIARIATQTNFNGTLIFNLGSGFAGAVRVFVGDLANTASISISVGYITTTGTTSVDDINGAYNTDLVNVHLDIAVNASTGLGYIKNALDAVSAMRGNIGAGINRLRSAVAVMQTQSQNTQAAESGIRDANIAQEVANMTKYQILAQSGIAALRQANSNGQLVLNLLRNI